MMTRQLKFYSVTMMLCFVLSSFLKADDVKAKQNPAKEMSTLYRLVGTEVGSCVEFSNLKEQIPHFVNSNFVRRFQKTSFYQSWRNGKDYQNFQEGLVKVEQVTGKSAEELAAQLIGDSAIIAVYPSLKGEPKGVLLTFTTDAKSLQETIAHWNRVDESQVEKRTHAGTVYFKKTNDKKKHPKKESVYYFQKEKLFVLTDHEEIVQQVIDFSKGVHTKEAIFESADFQKMHRSLSADSAVRIFVNPRAWDAAVKADANADEGEKAIIKLWRQCRSVSIGLQLKKGLVAEAMITWNNSDISSQWKQFVNTTSGQSSMLNKIPASAVVVACGKFDGTVLKYLFEAITSEKDRKQLQPQYMIAKGLLLELDPFDDLFANLGTNWGAWLQPAKNQQLSQFPFDGLLVTDLDNPNSPSKHKSEIPEALENITTLGLNALAVMYNSKKPADKPRAILRRNKHEKMLIRWVDTSAPYQLAVGISPNLLVISNSHLLIKKFIIPSGQASDLLIHSERFQKWSSRYFAKSSELFFVDVIALRQLMESYEKRLTQQISGSDVTPLVMQTKNQMILKKMKRIQEVLTPADLLFVSVRYLEDGIQLKIGAIAE